MNFIFPFLFLLCGAWFLLFSPENFLPALLAAAEKAAVLCFTLLASYAVFMGLAEVMEKSGVSGGISRLLRPAVKKLFITDDERAVRLVSINIAANMLGLSGVATPTGAAAAERFALLPEKEHNHTMLFVLNATSLQILPTTVLSLLVAAGAQDPYRVILPSLLATTASTVLGAALVLLGERLPRRRKK